MGFDGNRSRLAQEIEPVLPRVGRDASNDPLSKDLAIVVERGNRRHVNTGKGERAATLQCAQGRRNQFPSRRKDDRAVELIRRLVGRPAHPCGAQFTCETLMLRFQRADIDLTAPMTSNLNGNVSGRSKPIETETLARLDSTQTQCAVADDPGTEEGGRFFITEDRWNRIGKCCRDERILRISAIDLIAGKPGALAQVLAPARAKFADTARVLQARRSRLARRPSAHSRPAPT